jgi:hypothetical protein
LEACCRQEKGWWYDLERRAPSRLERIWFQLADTVLGAAFQQQTYPPLEKAWLAFPPMEGSIFC